MRIKLPNRPLTAEDDGVEIVDGARRGMFALAAAAPLLLLGFGSRAGAAAPACFNPAALPASQKAIRTSLGYKLQSADPKKRCGLCAFFKPAGGDCGKCDLLSGGPVTTTSVCNSWAAKPA